MVLALALATGCKKKAPLGVGDGGASEARGPNEPRSTPYERTAPVAIVAPAPLPEGLPLKRHVSPSGKGPAEYVDQAGMRSLLYFKKYALLEAAFETFQQRFEANPLEEDYVFLAGAAFESSEIELRQQLDGWVAASPESFAPYLARAAHHQSVGWDSRGGAWAKDTTKDSFSKMGEAHAQANRDLDKALALRPKLQAAYAMRVRMAKGSSGRDTAKAQLERATQQCPVCYRVRFAYAMGLEPRWGGSYEALDAFAKSVPVAKNPRLAVLAGLSDLDRAVTATHEKKYDAALALLDAATTHADAALFAEQRAEILSQRDGKDDGQAALSAIDHALDLAPWNAEYRIRRATILADLKRWKEAGEELLAGLRVSRTNANARAYHRYIVDWLVWQGWQEKRAGNRDLALDMLEVALSLAPTDRTAEGTYTAIIVGDTVPARDLPRLEAQVKANPHSFRAHQELDYALARVGRFKDVIQMWDGYIAAHPKDGRARLERGGAYVHYGDPAASHADARAACDLGVAEGCIQAARASK